MLFNTALQVLALAAAASAFKVEEVSVPMIEDDRHDNIGTTAITVGETTYETSYNVILRSGDKVGDAVFGAVLDENGNQIFAYPMDDGYVEIPVGNEPNETIPLISNIPDFTSLIATPQEGAPSEFAMFAHFETPLPATIYRINVDFATNCTVKEESLEATNWAEWGGMSSVVNVCVLALLLFAFNTTTFFIETLQDFGNLALERSHHGTLTWDRKNTSRMPR